MWVKVPNLYYLVIFQDLIHVDVKSLNDLTREGHEDGNFNPAQSLGNIFNLISGLSSKIKAEGQYLLKRDAAKNAAFVQGVYCWILNLNDGKKTEPSLTVLLEYFNTKE